MQNIRPAGQMWPTKPKILKLKVNVFYNIGSRVVKIPSDSDGIVSDKLVVRKIPPEIEEDD